MLTIILMFVLVAAGLATYLLRRDRGSREPAGALWAAFGFGVLAIIAAFILEHILLGDADPTAGTVSVGSMLGVGFIEEGVKFLPLAYFIYHKNYFNENTDGIIYFAICGLAFGLIENILYTVSYGASVGVTRIIISPFFHAATTGMVGFYLARAKLSGKSLAMPAVAFVALAVIHGLYDFGLSTRVPVSVALSLITALLMPVGLFLYYMHAGALDRAAGLSASGHNKFCRACGRQNVKHTLYCEFCGRPA